MSDTKENTALPLKLNREVLLDFLQVGWLLVDEKRNILHANNAIGRILGINPNDLPNHDLSEFFDKQTLTFFEKPELRDPVCNKAAWTCVLKTAKGQNRDVSLSITPYWDDSDTFCCIAQITDVTANKRTEKDLAKLAAKQASLLELGAERLLRADEAVEFGLQTAKLREDLLRQTEAGYQALFKASPIPTFAWKYDQGDFFLYDINHAVKSFMLIQIKDYLGARASDFFHDLPEALLDMNCCFDERRTVTRELEYPALTGENHYFLWHYSFVPPDQVLLYIQDIHHHKLTKKALDQMSQESLTLKKENRKKMSGVLEELKSEKALRVRSDSRLLEQQNFLREIIDLDPNLIYVCDWDGRYVLVNQALCLLLGSDRSQIIGRRQIDVAPWLGDDKLQENRIIMTTLQGKVFEECLENSKGDRLWFRTYKQPLATPDGLDQRILIVSVDITKEKRSGKLLLMERDQLKKTMETSPDGILVLTSDLQVEFANKQAVNLLGLPKNWKTSGLPLKQLSQSGEIDLDTANIGDVFLKGSTLRDMQLKVIHDSEILHLSVNIAPLPGPQGSEEKVILTLHDVTERKKSEEKIKMLSLAMDQSPASVIITNPEGQIEYVNARFTEISGYASAEVIGKTPLIFKSDQQLENYYEQIRETLASGQKWRGEVYNRAKNGDKYWVLVSVSSIVDDENIVRHWVAIEEEITQKKLQEEELRHMAVHDSLTGLANRLLFMDRMLIALSRAERQKKHLAVMFLDLNEFKVINDTMGHDAGDQLLKDVASRISSCLRPMDTAARFGGDEFVLLIPDVDSKEDAERIAQRLLHCLLIAYPLKGKNLALGASLGISLYPDNGLTPEDLICKADKAMYAAKDKGVNSYAFADKDW